MNNEELYNDGVYLLDTILKKFISEQNISDEQAEKYYIGFPEKSYFSIFHFDSLSKKYSICFPIYFSKNDDSAQYIGLLYVLMEDNLTFTRFEAIEQDNNIENNPHIFTKSIDDLKYENNPETIECLARIYYASKIFGKSVEGTDEYNKAHLSFMSVLDEYEKIVEKLNTKNESKATIENLEEVYDPTDEIVQKVEFDEIIKDNNQSDSIQSNTASEDEYEKIIKRLDNGNSENKKYDFEWDETLLLNYADDSSLEIAYNLIERGKISLATNEKKTNIRITSYLYGFCDANMTNDNYFKKYEENNHYNEKKDASVWEYTMGDPMDTATGSCYNCKYQSCPKFLAAYILYLKNNGILKEKLIERKKFRTEKCIHNGFFLFNWENKNGLKKIDEKSFEFANELVNRDYIRVKRCLNEKGLMEIHNILTCQDIQLSNMNIDKLICTKTWDNYQILKRKINSEPDALCDSYDCRMPICAIEVAGYIYYLRMSGQESKIKEDREYYANHKDEIDAEIQEKITNNIERVNAKKAEKIQDLKNSYDGKIENLNMTINSIMESDKTNFHCIVVGNEKDEKNSFIDKIVDLIKNENKIQDVRKISILDFAKLYSHYTNIRISQKEGVVYFDDEKEDPEKTTVKRDSQGIPYHNEYKDYLDYKVYRRNVLEKNAVYILDGVQEFVNDFHNYSEGYYKTKKMMTNALDILTDMSANGYIIISATKDEVDSFIALDTRLKFVYQNNIISIPTYSLDDMYSSYIKMLNSELIDELKKHEEEFQKLFNEYVSLNQKFMPFTKLETVNYMASYANTRNELVLPPNIYKKENLENIVGLETVKEKLKEFEKYMLFQIQAKANDIKLNASNMHMIFTGNPGTGKTTVARIMAKMLFDLGITKENKLVEVERKDLVGQYIGQTAPKTSEVIGKAIGGVLFVDEAYSLAGSKNDYGGEAIATLIKAMEDYKDNLVVIFAGYKNEMKAFTDMNPGIASRIGYTFDFPDYSVDELMEIFYLKLKNSGFEFGENTDICLRRICDYFSKRKNFGNGRFVDKVIQETLMKHALNSQENIKVIEANDIPSIEELNQNVYKNNKSETAEEMLSGLIGMENIKKELIQFKNYASFVKRAEEKKLSIPDTNMHMIFTGNPGTGKTTIARIIAKMLFDMEIIHENKLIEVERKDLVGEHLGESAPKTNDVIEKAMGGVLFIDEAYSLAHKQGEHDQLADEAIATLIKAMEDHKGDLVVIFAGYRDEMKTFVDMNPGIASRIGYTFNFEDYSVKELIDIFYMKMKKSGFECKESVELALKRDCDYYSRRKNFGNGRFVDKLIQKTLLKHANCNSQNIEIITEEDIPTIEELNQNTIKNSSSIEELFSNIVGMKELKEEVLSFGNYIKFAKEAEKRNIKIPDSNMHMIFTGNPGTGKTTIARIIAKMLFDMEVIHENKLVEVERKDLIAGYVGQTALKTTEVIEKAMGGVLFIDEAYSLTLGGGSQYDFGSEAIATLIKAMEDHKGEFVVIFAGYKEEMKRFIDSNSGIASRIGYTFNFADYEPNELAEIFEIKVKNTGMTLDNDAKEAVLKVMRYFSNVENFGNGRFVDKVFHQTIMKHSKKLLDDNIGVITKEDIPEINEMTKIMLGGENMIDVRKISKEALRKTAIHEVGHATARYLLNENLGIKKITINAEGRGTLGYVRFQSHTGSYTPGKTALLNDIKIDLAGLACEKVYYGEYESGGTSDIEHATATAYDMITRLGMSDIGLAKVKNPDGEIAKIIWDEENKILKQCFEDAEKLLSENKERIDKVVEYLLEKTEINEEEFISVFNGEENHE